MAEEEWAAFHEKRTLARMQLIKIFGEDYGGWIEIKFAHEADVDQLLPL